MIQLEKTTLIKGMVVQYQLRTDQDTLAIATQSHTRHNVT